MYNYGNLGCQSIRRALVTRVPVHYSIQWLLGDHYRYLLCESLNAHLLAPPQSYIAVA